MAADLTSESQAKLAKVKSRGVICMLVTDLLRLKLSNANIHTYTSCFMDIQQWEKESLAAYVLCFKTEAKCCNFTNDTATTRNAHSLAARIY